MKKRRRSKALEETATIGTPLSLDLFDHYEELQCHDAAVLIACWCMLNPKVDDKIPAWKAVVINEEHNFEDMTIAEMKSYVALYGPDIPPYRIEK